MIAKQFSFSLVPPAYPNPSFSVSFTRSVLLKFARINGEFSQLGGCSPPVFYPYEYFWMLNNVFDEVLALIESTG